jgi:hypothetical protein
VKKGWFSCWNEAKSELGLDHYELRSWLRWQSPVFSHDHHILLVAMAHYFLVRLRLQFQQHAPALTI